MPHQDCAFIHKIFSPNIYWYLLKVGSKEGSFLFSRRVFFAYKILRTQINYITIASEDEIHPAR